MLLFSKVNKHMKFANLAALGANVNEMKKENFFEKMGENVLNVILDQLTFTKIVYFIVYL